MFLNLGKVLRYLLSSRCTKSKNGLASRVHDICSHYHSVFNVREIDVVKISLELRVDLLQQVGEHSKSFGFCSESI